MDRVEYLLKYLEVLSRTMYELNQPYIDRKIQETMDEIESILFSGKE